MKRTIGILGAGIVLLTVACGGGETPVAKTPGASKTAGPGAATSDLSKDAQAKFNSAVDIFVEHDKKNDWNDDVCKDVASKFEDVGKNAQALFNAGLSVICRIRRIFEHSFQARQR